MSSAEIFLPRVLGVNKHDTKPISIDVEKRKERGAALTLKVQISSEADNILILLVNDFLENVRLNISCEPSASYAMSRLMSSEKYLFFFF